MVSFSRKQKWKVSNGRSAIGTGYLSGVAMGGGESGVQSKPPAKPEA